MFLAAAAISGTSLVSAQDRVISTDASLTAIIAALGRSEVLVGIDVTSAVPDGMPSVPRVGYHRALAAEGLLSLNPDTVLASEHAGPEPTLDALRKAGVTVRILPAALTVEVLQDNVRSVGAVLNAQQEAQTLAAALGERELGLQSRALDGVTALLLREGDGGLRAAGRETAGGALLQLLGAMNLADHPGYRAYSEEALLALEPALIVVALDQGERLEDWLARYPLLRYAPAVQSDQLVRVEGAALVGGMSMAAVSAAENLLQQLAQDSARAPQDGPLAP